MRCASSASAGPTAVEERISRPPSSARNRKARLKLRPSPDAKEIDRRLAELRAVVQKAFEARQALQDEELKRLRKRLQRIEAQIIGREQAKQRIIDRRVEDLVAPDVGTRRN